MCHFIQRAEATPLLVSLMGPYLLKPFSGSECRETDNVLIPIEFESLI